MTLKILASDRGLADIPYIYIKEKHALPKFSIADIPKYSIADSTQMQTPYTSIRQRIHINAFTRTLNPQL